MRAVSIIVPTFNEAENIDLLLQRIFAVELLRGFDLEVVFSDGASTDNTCERVEKWQSTNNVRLVTSEANEGLSAAVMAGARAASGEFVVVMDADLSHPPEAIPDMLRPLLSGDFDMVIGSRYIKGGDTPAWPLSRKISSFLATLPARLLTDVKDPLAGFIAVRRERLALMNREVCGFKIGLELLATSEEELRVKEIPIIFRDRCYGTSKMSAQVVMDYFKQLLMLTGIDLFPIRFQEIFLIGLAVMMTDCVLLTMMLESGFATGTAHWLSFFPASLVGGAMAFRSFRKRRKRTTGQRLTEYIFGYFWVLFLTLLLRSGLVSAMVSVDGGLSTAEVFWVSFFGLAVSYTGNAFYVLSIGQKRIRGQLVQRFYGLGVIFFLLLLRLLYCWGVDLLPEEQYYAGILSHSESLRALFSVPAPAIPGVIGHIFFDHPVFGFRVGGWLLWCMASVCIFSLTRDMYDRSVAFMAFLLFSILPAFVGTGLFVSADAILTLFWSCSLYVLYRALVGGVANAWLWCGITLGLGMQADAKLGVLLAGTIVYLLLSKEDRKWLYTPQPYMALGAMLLTLVPSMIFWSGGAALTPYEGPSWIDSIFGSATSESFWIIVLLLSPTGLLAGLYVSVQWCRAVTVVQTRSELDNRKNRVFLVSMFVLPLLTFMVPKLFAGGMVYASSVVWLILLPAMALTVGRQETVHDPVAGILNAIWWPTIGILMVTYGIALHLAVL